MTDKYERSTRRAAAVVLAGLTVQLATMVFWSPITFIVFTVVGVPLVLVGVGLYVATVIRFLKERKAL